MTSPLPMQEQMWRERGTRKQIKQFGMQQGTELGNVQQAASQRHGTSTTRNSTQPFQVWRIRFRSNKSLTVR